MNAFWRFLGLESTQDLHSVSGGTWEATRSIDPFWPWFLGSLGVLLALVNFLPWIAMRWQIRVGTFLLRAGITVLLIVALVGLEWHASVETNEKQRWVIVLDDSGSMATADVGNKARYVVAKADLDALQSRLGERVLLDVVTMSGQPAGDQAGQGPSRFRDALDRAALARAKPDRVVILTDGRDSEQRDFQGLGEELRARGVRLSAALYGSDSPARDVGISAEPEKSALRLGEELVIRGHVHGMIGSEEPVILKEDNKEVLRATAGAKNRGQFVLRWKPKAKGQRVYSVELEKSDEAPLNNAARFSVLVLEEKINVLLIEGFPRFEFKLMKSVLEADPLVNLVSLCQIPGGGWHVQGEPLHRNAEQGLIAAQVDLFKYDVVILRDVPRAAFRAGGDTTESRLQHMVQHVLKRGGGLMVLGGQDVYRAGGYGTSVLAEILPFDLSDRISGEDQFEGMFHVSIPAPAYGHPLLQLLPDQVANRERLNSLRQLDGSNNVGAFKPLATPLLTRMVKVKGKSAEMVEKETPILGYMAVGEGKVLAAAVDTFWRWQLQPDYDDPPLTALLANAVRFLAPPPGRKPGSPDVTLAQALPQVGQEVLMTSDLRDANYDPLTNADLLVSVQRPDGTVLRLYPRDLTEEPGHYAYRIPVEQPGLHKVTAKYGKQETTREFLAGAAAGEFADLSVDRGNISRLLKAAHGEEVDDVSFWIDRADVEPKHQSSTRTIAVWNSWAVLLLFFGLVCWDCYLRKRQGLV